MKSSSERYLFLLILLALFFVPAFTITKPVSYQVNVEQSKLLWTGYYLFSFSEHRGNIELSGGEVTIENGEIVSGFFEIDMRSIKDLDMSQDDGAKDLEQHLMSVDFFSAEQFPKSRFDIIGAEKIKDAKEGMPNYDITGALTIKGVKNSLTFPALLQFNENGVDATAKFKFDRTKWNIRYNSGKFFSEVGDGAISDAIGIDIHLVTTK